ncbi:uncharacterized protein BDZ99DRAFT_403092 [Mytilinidion resinicola]|uniref:Uncharacterized protein n=1 Tax=Mytilinidion resinicola TaxID=574789 RepID=A0A6A6XZ60_9PEZI|nr:uncharacterized protein BDZ99DRAFT_403092 [Mytilinidion resinicola]KAF2801578.1 hypothetical protein BDZ99DRAFT_403092 [Mytilinidion resinicola]
MTHGFFNPDPEIYKKEKPYVCLVPLTNAPPGFQQSNVEYHNKDVNVCDIRRSEETFKLDVHGFQLVKHRPAYDAWHDGIRVIREYYPHIVDLLKSQLGAQRVHIYDHTVISPIHPSQNVQGAPSISAHAGKYELEVHHTLDSPIHQVKEDLPGESDALLRGHFQISHSVRHPIVEPIEQHPLALCDYRTSKLDGHPSDLVNPHFDSENLQVAYSSLQKWYFINRQTIDEAWMIKMADSEAVVLLTTVQVAPHTSFVVPWARKDCAPRESIEFRAYVFYGGAE